MGVTVQAYLLLLVATFVAQAADEPTTTRAPGLPGLPTVPTAPTPPLAPTLPPLPTLPTLPTLPPAIPVTLPPLPTLPALLAPPNGSAAVINLTRSGNDTENQLMEFEYIRMRYKP
uniref:Vegetative cell wall protein gp1-like n=1 Tax=Steinernema glaseri TaxID=37863 RepID=A0A1I7ZL21_9BILA